MTTTIQNHITALGEQVKDLKTEEQSVLAQIEFRRDALSTQISEMERVADKYPNAVIGSMGGRKIVMTADVNSRVDSVYCTHFNTSLGDGDASEIEGYFFLQDGPTTIYSSPGIFTVGFYSYDSQERTAEVTLDDAWKAEAAAANIPAEMIEKLHQHVIEEYGVKQK